MNQFIVDHSKVYYVEEYEYVFLDTAQLTN